MFTDVKTQFDEQLQRNIEANSKVRELSTQFASDAAMRNNDFVNQMVQSSLENSQALAQCATPTQLLEKQVELTNQFREGVESYLKTSFEALTQYGQTVTELTGELVQASSPKVTPSSRRKNPKDA
ncbi:phasin family protein [Ferrimonas balearica]|uniref:phasin family protein n=1 Tax=Ferrimonas balearica TaxID=44012 RepID=UPI001C990B67|nr:phasin family protein [Ferrimonas balearica]MBY5920179.1 phasin family protein [Ferrimonas balearica]MBY5997136.1 phasin family protein [Ferrimonas balearica]